MKRHFYLQIDVSIGNFSPKITQKCYFSLKIGELGKIGKLRRSKIHLKSFTIHKMHFLVKLHPYISVFVKVSAFLLLLEFDRGIDGEIYNDVIGRSRALLTILILLKKIGK